GLIRIGLTVETTSHWVLMGACSDELVVAAHRLAQRHGLVITDHIAGGTLSRGEGYLKYIQDTGRTDILYLQQLGVLDERWLLIHAIWLQDRDIDMIARSGAPVVHCPTSHGMRAGGTTPVHRLLEAGANVALGSDGPMVDNTVDMVEQMKATCIEQNQWHLDPKAVAPTTALEMATINGARALGMDDQIGSLEVRKRADIAVFDMRRPHIGVVHRPITSLVTAARGTDAWLVMVNGRILFRDGVFTTVPEVGGILTEAQIRSEALVARAGLAALCDQPWPVVT
ncbi:MAG: amidohydrolase family protein, partial [Dehalococcoidia bacterium]